MKSKSGGRYAPVAALVRAASRDAAFPRLGRIFTIIDADRRLTSAFGWRACHIGLAMTNRSYPSATAPLQNTLARAGDTPRQQRAGSRAFLGAMSERSAARLGGAAAISILVIVAQLMWWTQLQTVLSSGPQILLLTISFVAFAAILSVPTSADDDPA